MASSLMSWFGSLAAVIHVLMSIYLVAMMFSMGVDLDPHPKETRGHKVSLILRGLLLNLVLLPLVTIALVRALHVRGEFAIALTLLAIAPGGRFAPHLARIAHAEASIAAEVTLFLAKVTPFTAPFLLKRLFPSHDVEFSEWPFVLQLFLLQFVPYFAGQTLRRRFAGVAERLSRPLQRFAAFAAGALICLIAGTLIADHGLAAITVLGDRGWLAVAVVALVGIGLGWLLGGPALRTRQALALTANARNMALAVVLASVAFPRREVQLVTIGIWVVLLVLGLLYAQLVRASQRGAEASRPSPVDRKDGSASSGQALPST